MAGSVTENLWKDSLKRKFPQYFNGVRVLDIGAADINGTNVSWFDNCRYVGLDILPYKNVDVVSVAHEYNALPESFDVVCSTSELEHDMYWRLTLKKMVELLKPKGLMFFAASHSMGEHGTLSHNPLDSLTTQLGEHPHLNPWVNYYGNITKEMVKEAINLDAIFEQYEIEYQGNPGQPDLFIHFWGIKKGK